MKSSWGEPEHCSTHSLIQRSVVRLVYSCSQMQPMHLELVELRHTHTHVLSLVAIYTYTQRVRKGLHGHTAVLIPQPHLRDTKMNKPVCACVNSARTRSYTYTQRVRKILHRGFAHALSLN